MRSERGLSPVARLVRRHDPDRFLTVLFAPADRREDLFALYAFNYELARTREVVREPILGRIRLQWWRETVAEIAAGGAVRRHEVALPLADAVRRGGLAPQQLETLIAARERDLADAPPASLAELEAYCDATGGALALLALAILGVENAAAAAAARHVGSAYALAGLLRAVAFHARAKRCYLPADLMAAAGPHVLADLFALKPSAALNRVAAEVAAMARTRLAAGRELRRGVTREALPAVLGGVIAERTLDRLARAGHDPLAPELGLPDRARAWRLAAAALTGRY